MAQRYSVTKNTLIGEIRESLGSKPVLVKPESDLYELTHRIVEEPKSHTFCVVDDSQRLVGLIPLQTLLDAIFYYVVPEEFLAEVSDYEELLHFVQLSHTKTAKDLMKDPVWLRDDDRVKDAFVRMHASQCLEGLPVVDKDLHVIGFVGMLELLSLWAKEEEERRRRGKR